MEKSKNQKNKVRFVVVREFSGEKSMRKPLSSLLSARPANTSRNGVIREKWQKKLRKNG